MCIICNSIRCIIYLQINTESIYYMIYVRNNCDMLMIWYVTYHHTPLQQTNYSSLFYSGFIRIYYYHQPSQYTLPPFPVIAANLTATSKVQTVISFNSLTRSISAPYEQLIAVLT